MLDSTDDSCNIFLKGKERIGFFPNFSHYCDIYKHYINKLWHEFSNFYKHFSHLFGYRRWEPNMLSSDLTYGSLGFLRFFFPKQKCKKNEKKNDLRDGEKGEKKSGTPPTVIHLSQPVLATCFASSFCVMELHWGRRKGGNSRRPHPQCTETAPRSPFNAAAAGFALLSSLLRSARRQQSEPSSLRPLPSFVIRPRDSIDSAGNPNLPPKEANSSFSPQLYRHLVAAPIISAGMTFKWNASNGY